MAVVLLVLAACEGGETTSDPCAVANPVDHAAIVVLCGAGTSAADAGAVIVESDAGPSDLDDGDGGAP